MRSLTIAAALALAAAPAFADQPSSPFEQTQLDRALPAIAERATLHQPTRVERMPFEQTQLDRGIDPTVLNSPEAQVLLAQMGRLYYRNGTADSPASESPWGKDHYFQAPAP